VQWSEQQSAALKAVELWLNDKKSKQVFKLFGYAGSGKTTLALEIAESARPKGRVLFATFTGKAAMVMQAKGCNGAQTIHSLIYKLEGEEAVGKKREPIFSLNPDSLLKTAALLIVDECSMLGPDLGQDLLSFKTKILVLGDPAQLPPINGQGFFNGEPDVMLKDIHRQAKDNPIIRLSMLVRTGKGIKTGTYGNSKVVRLDEADQDEYMACNQLLCGRNTTRKGFNRKLRNRLGFSEPLFPMEEEKLICLRNNPKKGLLNGGMWKVRSSELDASNVKMKLYSMDLPCSQDVIVPLEFFSAEQVNLDWRERKKIDEFDYAYAITVHKSQGSQWPYVVVFNENQAFREHAAKWLYTAITRASERVTIII
jgi:exodeoxyribonuclease-5